MRSKFAIAIVLMAGASTSIATPTSAGEHRTHRHHARMYHHDNSRAGFRDNSGYRIESGQRDYSGYLDPNSQHYDPEFQRNRENFGFSGRDPSRVGGMDPSLHPPGIGR